jgi:thioesterase domain-containing protein
VTGAHQVAAQVLSRGHEVAALLFLDARHAHEGQLTGGE